MANETSAKGSCLCKAVGIEVESMKASLGACHCGTCRKWSGSLYFAIDCGSEGVSFKGESNISVFNSSEWADRGFCSKCGTHLFYRLKETKHYHVAAGLFDGFDDKFSFDHQVFIDEKPPYYDFANKTENMTGEELFAKFSG